MQTKLIEKIQKLLALSQSNHESEATAAILKAQELLLKNNLTMSDIKDVSHEKEELLEENITTFTKSPWWSFNLLNTIAENFRCIAVVRKHKRSDKESHHFMIGMENDVAVAREIHTYAEKYLLHSIQLQKQQLQYTTKNIKMLNALVNDYIFGFLEGLKTSFARQVTEKGLTIVKNSDVTRWAMINKVRTTSQKVNALSDSNQYSIGYQDGKNFDPATKQIQPQ